MKCAILRDVNKMTRRTIDETGRDISEQPQPEPEPIRTGWYWTGRYVVWAVGPTANGRGVYFETAKRLDWLPLRTVTHWQRVHEQVKESGQGFGRRPNAPHD